MKKLIALILLLNGCASIDKPAEEYNADLHEIKLLKEIDPTIHFWFDNREYIWDTYRHEDRRFK